MKLARVTCTNPSCRTITQSPIEDDQQFLKCSVCDQMNTTPDQCPQIDGRCSQCHDPIDATGHYWYGGEFAECRRRK